MESLVIVTGAGASVHLGRDRDLPMMSGWADDLRRRLGNLADQLGLKPQMDGIEFEECIGRFLRFTRGLDDVASYPWIGYADSMKPVNDAESWFRQAATSSKQIQQTIFESLHELFGFGRIDATKAEMAYGKLFEYLHPEKVALATTNYDVSGEMALDRLGFRPYSGHDGSLEFGRVQRVHVEGITDRNPDRSPVLYLHGRVSWYVQPDGSLAAADPQSPFNADSGTPALLLPDPEKLYDAPATSILWQQFEELIAPGSAVLVLGHSLTDAKLVDALRRQKPDRLAVSLYIPPNETDVGRRVGEERARLTGLLGRDAIVLPLQFGPQVIGSKRALQFFSDSLSQGTDADYDFGPL